MGNQSLKLVEAWITQVVPAGVSMCKLKAPSHFGPLKPVWHEPGRYWVL